MYAIINWLNTIFIAFFIPNSFFIIPIVAMQGVYNNMKVKKLIAELWVNMLLIIIGSMLEFAFVSILNVLNIASFAEIPTMIEVTIFQFENPSGLNINEIFCPIIANILSPSGTKTNS